MQNESEVMQLTFSVFFLVVLSIFNIIFSRKPHENSGADPGILKEGVPKLRTDRTLAPLGTGGV